MQKLGFMLACKGTGDDLGGMKMRKRVDLDGMVLPKERLFDEEFPVTVDAVRRDVRMLSWCVSVARYVESFLLVADDMSVEVPLVLQAVIAFLDVIGAMSLRKSQSPPFFRWSP